ncbi:hypothetical protein [Roseibacillus persicicus]|uniref:hypothetical protein n=1 Tax=Roseibacillus persicicus TaxID=454148 RepID=UPI00280E0FC5|nr:hypothetical protein [Roseibacillus persicicus]MDQ8192671.1 hypothetical protein [Roseibacillus persicicus]
MKVSKLKLLLRLLNQRSFFLPFLLLLPIALISCENKTMRQEDAVLNDLEVFMGKEVYLILESSYSVHGRIVEVGSQGVLLENVNFTKNPAKGTHPFTAVSGWIRSSHIEYVIEASFNRI